MTGEEKVFTPIASGEFGIVSDAWVHDSEIVGIFLPDSKRKTLKIYLQAESGEKHEIEFEEVRAFSCSAFTLQNVVLEMLLQSKADLDNDVKGAFADCDPKYVEELCDRIRQGKSSYANLQPSVGCEIKIVFDRLKHSISK